MSGWCLGLVWGVYRGLGDILVMSGCVWGVSGGLWLCPVVFVGGWWCLVVSGGYIGVCVISE